MTGALALIYIDQTAVAVALPTIGDELGLSDLALQWVINAYLLALAGTVAIAGRLGDVYGRRRLFLAGTTILALGSVAGALAQDELLMLSGRVLQGIGAGMMMPNATGLVSESYAEHERGRALGICLGVSGAFLALGPVIGGVLVDAFGWRSVFVLNLPVIGCVAGLVFLRVAGRRGAAGARVSDPLGAGVVIAALVAIVIALMQAESWGWTSARTIALGGGGSLALAVAIVRELRIPAPFFNLRLFAQRTYAGASLGVSVNRLAVVIVTVYTSIYLQQVIGMSASTAGVALLALALPTVVAAPLAGRLADRVGPAGVCNFGMVVTAAGALLVAVGMDRQGTALVIVGLVPIAIGSGVVQPSANLAAMNTVAGEQESEAFGLMAASRQLAATLGLAVIGGIIVTADLATGFYVTAALCAVAAAVTAWLLRRGPRA
jgi:EmrB/QacA subfamily drug resistance transporter